MKIIVNDKMQKNYQYELTAPEGKGFDPSFKPDLTPPQMLELGIFEGKYLNDCREEFPASWYKKAKLSDKADPEINYFKLKSRLPLAEWRRRGWIAEPDPRGWFQWYCRYYRGRRIEGLDQWQIKRWRAFIRHKAQIEHNCFNGDLNCRPKQRQALLQWAYNPFI